MNRRALLQLAAARWGAASAAPLAAGLALATPTRLWALPEGVGARLLVVFLRGGYDALTLWVPRGSSFYAEVRPNLAVPVAASGAGPDGAGPPAPAAEPIDTDWALHPAVADSLGALLKAGQLSAVPFAGTDDLTRSHFETQDAIEMGQPLQGRRDAQSGFLNRLAQVLGGERGDRGDRGDRGAGAEPRAAAALASPWAPIAFSEQLPLAFRGPVPVANMSLRNAPGRAGNDRLQAAIAAMYEGHPLKGRVDDAFALREQVSRQLAEEMDASGRRAISAGGFEAEARRIGRVMREQHALGFVDVGGWDTHVGQGSLQGALPGRLAELGRGLASYAAALGEREWRRTVVVVMSEFGRTLRENGARGTDHGHGSVWWVMGGALRGRAIAGEQRPISARHLHQDRDLPVLNEYRALLGGLMQRQFGLSAAALQRVFPGAAAVDLGIV